MSSEHQENSVDLFESSAGNSDSPVQQSVGSREHTLQEACCTLTASTASINDSHDVFDPSDVNNSLTEEGWKEHSDCSVCDISQYIEPCMPDI